MQSAFEANMALWRYILILANSLTIFLRMACFDNANPTLQYKSFEQRYATILMSVGTEQPFLVSIQA